MWPSRCSLRVLIEVTSISAWTAGVPFSSTVMVPEKVSKLPRTLLTMRCFTEKFTAECTVSMVQVPAGMGALTVVAEVMSWSFQKFSVRVSIDGWWAFATHHQTLTGPRSDFIPTGVVIYITGEPSVLRSRRWRFHAAPRR